MKTTNDGSPLPRHLDDDDLICYLDGEVTRAEQDFARTHLEGCWNCRSRLLSVQNSIESFLRLRKQVRPPEVPPSTAVMAQFRRRLSEHRTVPAGVHLQFRRWLRSLVSSPFERSSSGRLLPDLSLISIYKKTALASALAVVALVTLLFDPFGLNQVSADELLSRAGAYEFLNESPSGKVVRARVRVDRIAVASHLETKIGEIELAEDSLTSSVHISAHHASGGTDQETLSDREKLSEVNLFAGEFIPVTARYLTVHSLFPQVSVSAYRRLIAGRGLAGNDGAFTAIKGDTYELHHPFPAAHSSGITETVLVLNAQSYAPRAISIFATDGRERFEYRLTRTAFERVDRTPEVARLFESSSDGTLLNARSDSGHATPETLSELKTGDPKLETAEASADLEVEVLRLVHQAGADLGEQISVTRSVHGPVRVNGIVDSDQRKNEILRALQPLAGNPAVRIEVKTVAEAMAERRDKRDASRTTTIEGVEVAADTFPAYQDLRARMSDEEARVFAARMVSRSHSAMRHAWALKRLMAQFSASDLATLQPEARAKWIALIQSHARQFESENRSLREQLQPIFGSGSAGVPPAASSVTGDAELIRAVERLIALASTNYEVVRSAFTVNSESGAVSAIKTPQFWQSLRSAEAVAASISRAQ